MGIRAVNRQGQHLHVALGEFVGKLGRVAQFGGAHGREVGRMRKEYPPAIAQILVKADGTGRGILFKIRGGVAQT
ncbi:hypothetical protein D3C87_2133630 [compost metagenome]